MPEPGYLLVAFLASSVGFVLLVYGRRQRRPMQLAGGLLLMAVSFLVRDALWLGMVSAAICLGVWVGVRAGL